MSQVILNGVVSFFFLLILGLGVNAIYIAVRFIDLSLAGVITLCCYCLYFLVRTTHLSWIPAIALSLALSICLAIFLHRLMFKKLLDANNTSLTKLLISLGVYLIFQNAIAATFGNDIKTIDNSLIEVGHYYFGAYVSNIQLSTIFVSACLYILAQILLRITRLGLAIRGASSNSELCRSLGINADLVSLLSVTLGVFLCGIAAILSSIDTGMSPTMGFRLIMNGLIVMVVGGIGSVVGLLGGALILAAAQTLTSYYIDSKWMDAISFIIMIVFLIWKPLGFSGRRLKKIEI